MMLLAAYFAFMAGVVLGGLLAVARMSDDLDRLTAEIRKMRKRDEAPDFVPSEWSA